MILVLVHMPAAYEIPLTKLPREVGYKITIVLDDASLFLGVCILGLMPPPRYISWRSGSFPRIAKLIDPWHKKTLMVNEPFKPIDVHVPPDDYRWVIRLRERGVVLRWFGHILLPDNASTH